MALPDQWMPVVVIANIILGIDTPIRDDISNRRLRE